MSNQHPQKLPPDDDAAFRARILRRAQEINGVLLARLATVSDDLDAGRHRAALGGLDGFERELANMRAVLRLLP